MLVQIAYFDPVLNADFSAADAMMAAFNFVGVV